MAFDIIDFIKKKLGKKSSARKTAPEKKSNQAKSAKDKATEAGEPYVSILKVDLDPKNPRYGSFELDWNSHFVETLTNNGYRGDSEESIVDQWFQDVCRHVVLETYEQEQANIGRNDNVVRYINRKERGDGKTEVS